MAKRRQGLLITESARDFARRHKELVDQIGPCGSVEKMYVDDSAFVSWEIDRFRRIGAELFNLHFVKALENLLKQMLSREDYDTHLDLEREAEYYARHYFDDEDVKAEVGKLLQRFQLTEAAVEAAAFRLCSPDLEALDRMLAFRTGRRDKDLFVLSEIRQSKHLQPINDPALENEIPRLVEVVKLGS